MSDRRSSRRPSYGDVLGEYLALREGAGLIRAAHELVWVRGPDAVSFLEGLVSQAIDRLEPGDVARSLLLEPRGKLRGHLWLLVGDAEVGLVADAGRGEIVAGDLARFKIRVDATIEPHPGELIEVWGPDAAAVLETAGLPVPDGWVRDREVLVAAMPFRHGMPDRYVIAGMDTEALVEAGAVLCGTVAETTVRIEAGEPVVGIDADESTIPAEADLVEGAVAFDKGCFLGQELVARIDSRGHVNRHLRGVVMEDAVVPPSGAEILREGDVVGSVTSWGESPRLRAPVGLGLVRREVSPGDRVTIRWEGGSAPAHVAALPLVE